eukprot:76921-Rhodomonas_salina.4
MSFFLSCLCTQASLLNRTALAALLPLEQHFIIGSLARRSSFGRRSCSLPPQRIQVHLRFPASAPFNGFQQAPASATERRCFRHVSTAEARQSTVVSSKRQPLEKEIREEDREEDGGRRTVEGGQWKEDRGRRTESGGQREEKQWKEEDRVSSGKRIEGGRQKEEDRGRRTEGGCGAPQTWGRLASTRPTPPHPPASTAPAVQNAS